ncbi:MAG: hypothetical protein ACO3CC_16645, partial [Alphaproteobacteria bacterium]
MTTEHAAPAGLAARQAAHELLGAVLRRRQPLDGAFDASERVAALPPRDRALARLVAATALRRLADMPARGWHGADLHVHMNYGGAYRNDPKGLLFQAEAEGLNLVENL